MSMIPVVASAEEIPDAIKYAETHRNSRWYISRRIHVLGKPELIPEEWGLSAAASSNHLPEARKRLSSKPSWPVPTGKPGLAQSPALAGDAEPSDSESQLQDLGALTDQQLSELAGEITQAFEQADSDDDLDAMNQAADAIGAVRAEADRRGLSLDAPPRPVTAAGTGTRAMARPPVAADRQPLSAGKRRTGNTVVAGGGTAPPWASMITHTTAADFKSDSIGSREAAAMAEAENQRRIAAAIAADQQMRVEADAAGHQMAKVSAAAVAERWAPFGWLYEATQANPPAPAWCVSVWTNAFVSPDATITPLDWEYQRLQAPVLGSSGLARTWWRTSWHLVEEMTAGRHNKMPDPAVAVRASWRSPETSWVATSDEGLLAALIELQPGPDLTAAVRANRLVGDSPITKLAGMLLGPGRTERGLPNDTLAHYGPQSRMVEFAEQLRGGAPEAVDRAVLDALSPEQHQALATLAASATT